MDSHRTDMILAKAKRVAAARALFHVNLLAGSDRARVAIPTIKFAMPSQSDSSNEEPHKSRQGTTCVRILVSSDHEMPF